MDELLSQFGEVPKAPKKPASNGHKLPAKAITTELAIHALPLILNGKPFTSAEMREIPLFKQTYTSTQSPVPTYLGAGRMADGLGFHYKGDLFTPCRENGVLALRKLRENGVDLNKVATSLGFENVEALVAAVASLPPSL